MQALEDLDYLAALDDDGDLSDLGIILSEFPLPPELAKALLASCEFNCVDEMLTLAAMLTGILLDLMCPGLRILSLINQDFGLLLCWGIVPGVSCLLGSTGVKLESLVVSPPTLRTPRELDVHSSLPVIPTAFSLMLLFLPTLTRSTHLSDTALSLQLCNVILLPVSPG